MEPTHHAKAIKSVIPEEANQPAADESSVDESSVHETEAEQQARWAREHRLQLRRLQCPGCGENELF